MRSRLITNIFVLVAGAVVVVSSKAFSPGTLQWIAFGISLGVLGMTALAQVSPTRGSAERTVDGIVGLLAIWSAIASMVFNGSSLTWLSFGNGIALFAVAIAGLAAHERFTERVVRVLAAVEPSDPTVKPAEPYPVAA